MEIKNEFCAQFSSSSRVKGFWSNPIPTKMQIRACNLWPGQIELSHCSSCRSVASGLKKKIWMDDLGTTVPLIEKKLCIYHALKCALVLDRELQTCSSRSTAHDIIKIQKWMHHWLVDKCVRRNETSLFISKLILCFFLILQKRRDVSCPWLVSWTINFLSLILSIWPYQCPFWYDV